MADQLSDVYAALGDPTRRQIVSRLRERDLTVAELRRPLPMSAPAVSKHLRVLEGVQLIERRKLGRNQVCRLRIENLVAARRWLDEQTVFWTSTLDSLAAHLERDQERPAQ